MILTFSMYGYVPSKFIPLMILEHCELGDILKYLIDNEENFKVNDLISTCKCLESRVELSVFEKSHHLLGKFATEW